MKNWLKYFVSLFFWKIRLYLKEGKINEYRVNLIMNLICRKYLFKFIKKKKLNLLKLLFFNYVKCVFISLECIFLSNEKKIILIIILWKKKIFFFLEIK